MTGTPHHPRRHPRAGLTLLEVMVVMAILALIVGLAAPSVIGSLDRAKGQAAEIQMMNLKAAVQMFYIDTGRYPTAAEGLGALLDAPRGAEGWAGPYIDDAAGLTDPWGRRYLLEVPGEDAVFTIRSYGRDGRAGGTSEDRDLSL